MRRQIGICARHHRAPRVRTAATPRPSRPQAPRRPSKRNPSAEALRNLRTQPLSALAQGTHEIQCNGCGAVTLLTAQASSCPFCDSPVVAPNVQDRTTIVPESVLPFFIDDRKAGETFKTWVESRWFAPNDLAAKARRAAWTASTCPTTPTTRSPPLRIEVNAASTTTSPRPTRTRRARRRHDRFKRPAGTPPAATFNVDSTTS